ncbi:hypothetical protein V6N13_132774 [Hibiscus sabdariffa]|uniref:Uncharacterized protein n=1 Tax=Hibiscus sabdariffa TaxID=183260 RepID=A0ABR2PW86_9ROSI
MRSRETSNPWNLLGARGRDGVLKALSFRAWKRKPDWQQKMMDSAYDPTDREQLFTVEWRQTSEILDDEVIPSTGVQDLSDDPHDSLKDEVSVMAFEEPIQDLFGLSRATTHHDMSNFNPNQGTSNVDSSMSYEIENDRRLRELERVWVAKQMVKRRLMAVLGKGVTTQLMPTTATGITYQFVNVDDSYGFRLLVMEYFSDRDISNSTRKGRSKGEDPTLRSAALDHIFMDQTQGQECLMVLVETMTFEEVNSNGVLFQQIFSKDTNERKVAYIAGPAHNW